MPATFDLPGLKEPVSVLYDDMLIPHIFAHNDEDLYMATGYVHAFHRLWQMEFQTHAAAGRVSETIGGMALDYDRGQRRKGMVFGAENFIKSLDKKSKAILNAYTKGVNAFIDQLSEEDFPFEYKLLDYAPERWTPLKSALMYKYMSDMLNAREKDLENTNFRKLYGKELLNLIYPDVDNYADPVVERINDWDFEPVTKEAANDITDELVLVQPVEGADERNGSNNWAVGPKKTASGHAILCNDMHLNLYLPSLWFYIQQNDGSANVFGHSLPGIPFVITGFTDSIAWGFTNAQRDLVDWYKIEFENEKRDRYLLDGKYVNAEKRIEEIKIRGDKTYYDTVVYTIFGPVMYDNTFRAKSGLNGYARRWIDHDPSPGFQMFYNLNRAKNFDDYMDALDFFTSPAQNIVFASVSGDIAHRVQGKFPLNNFEEGKFLKDGARSSNNWTKFIPNEHNAFWKNPERGFVSSANQHPADSTYPYYYTANSYESYRNRRINDVLRKKSGITVDDMKNLQFDNFGLKAAEALPWMLEQLNGENLTASEMDILQSLKDWDYRFTKNSIVPVYFDIWYRLLYSMIWDEIKINRDKNIWLKYPTNYATIRLMKEDPSNPFFDRISTDNNENAHDLAIISFHEMTGEIDSLRKEKGTLDWATYKGTYVGHNLRLRALGSYDIPTDGSGGDVVNATGTNHAPSQRIIIELDPDGIKAIGHYPGGQSGNPGSKYYDNMVEAWATGKYYDLLFLTRPDDRNKRIIFSQTLNNRQ